MAPLGDRDRDRAARHYPLACRIAGRFARACPASDRDELLSDAGLAATLAARDWGGRGDFRTYLTLRVTAAMLAATRDDEG